MSDSARAGRRFQLILIKPSHYDDDGYVIQWFRSIMPSNSLGALYGLAIDAATRQVLGADVSIDVTPVDETNTRIKPKAIIAQLRRHGGFGLVGLVGVQSNQFPRAMDIARPLRSAGISVMIGGFHISGCLSMLTEMQPDIQEALDLGVSLFAGEVEERLDAVLRDAAGGRLKPIYNYLDGLPSIQSAPTPFLPRKHVARTVAIIRHSTPAAVVRINARFARSSMCRGENRGGVRPTMSSVSFVRIGKRASTASSSPTTISLAIRIGSPFLTAS